jgi:D-alanyl-D-alanine carboxypeptidase
MVALKYGNLDDVITCTEEVYNLEEDASNLAYQPGEKVTMRDALYGLMLHSANELGIAIAVHMAGSVPAFADMMNAEAEALGCVNTHFSNPHGLHSDDHYTCAKDMALLSREAYKIDVFRQIIRTTEFFLVTVPCCLGKRPAFEFKVHTFSFQFLITLKSSFYTTSISSL